MKKCSDINNIVLAGAGVMGISFAQIFAMNGFAVTLYDISEDILRKAKERIGKGLETMAQEGAIDTKDLETISARVSVTTSKECFCEADFILEAIIEKMDIKHSFYLFRPPKLHHLLE